MEKEYFVSIKMIIKVKNNLLLIQNNIFELFNFGDSIYIGIFIKDKKEGIGIFYMNNK